MPTAVAAARQSYADHPAYGQAGDGATRPVPCSVITGDAFWDFHRMRDCNTKLGGRLDSLSGMIPRSLPPVNLTHFQPGSVVSPVIMRHPIT